MPVQEFSGFSCCFSSNVMSWFVFVQIGSPYKFWFHLKVEDAELFRMDVNLK